MGGREGGREGGGVASGAHRKHGTTTQTQHVIKHKHMAGYEHVAQRCMAKGTVCDCWARRRERLSVPIAWHMGHACRQAGNQLASDYRAALLAGTFVLSESSLCPRSPYHRVTEVASLRGALLPLWQRRIGSTTHVR